MLKYVFVHIVLAAVLGVHFDCIQYEDLMLIFQFRPQSIRPIWIHGIGLIDYYCVWTLIFHSAPDQNCRKQFADHCFDDLTRAVHLKMILAKNQAGELMFQNHPVM